MLLQTLLFLRYQNKNELGFVIGIFQNIYMFRLIFQKIIIRKATNIFISLDI